MERTNQICSLCKLPINDPKWMVIREKIYHNDCIECGTCKKRGELKHFVIREDMAFCEDCDASALSKHASINTWNNDAQVQQCSLCKSTAVGQRLLRAGKIYCDHCYRCYHCQQPMNSDNCLLLLDRLYCYGCENEFNVQKYMLAKWGSGPLVLNFL